MPSGVSGAELFCALYVGLFWRLFIWCFLFVLFEYALGIQGANVAEDIRAISLGVCGAVRTRDRLDLYIGRPFTLPGVGGSSSGSGNDRPCYILAFPFHSQT